MTTGDLAKLQADSLAISKQLDAQDQSILVLQANLALALNQSRRAASECRAVVVRLEELEKASKDTAHRMTSLRSALLANMDYLDRVDPLPKAGE